MTDVDLLQRRHRPHFVSCRSPNRPALYVHRRHFGRFDRQGSDEEIPVFDFKVPTEFPGVDSKILDPRDTYANAADWDVKAKDLAGRFIKNFTKFTGNEEGKSLVAAGPKL